MKSNLVKTFLVLNLLLCGGAVAFTYQIFRDRELIKAHTLILQRNVDKIASNLNWGQKVAWEEGDPIRKGLFQLGLPQDLQGMKDFTSQLEDLNQMAGERVAQLTAEYDRLVQTRQEWADTREVLAQRVQDLTETRARVAGLQENLANTQRSLRETQTEVANLERDNLSLQSQLDDLNTQISSQEEKIANTEKILAVRTGERDRIQQLVIACRRPVNQDGGLTEWHGKTAQVLAVDPEWNFVIINRGEVDVLPMYLEAFVHRGEEFIGKIRVMQVGPTVALAEVIENTLADGAAIQAGDTLFF